MRNERRVRLVSSRQSEARDLSSLQRSRRNVSKEIRTLCELGSAEMILINALPSAMHSRWYLKYRTRQLADREPIKRNNAFVGIKI